MEKITDVHYICSRQFLTSWCSSHETYLNEKMYIIIYNVGQSQGVIWAIFRVFVIILAKLFSIFDQKFRKLYSILSNYWHIITLLKLYGTDLHLHPKILSDTYYSSSLVLALLQYKKTPENNLPLLLQLVANGFLYQVYTINLKLA